jgi:hypothetical protein
MSAGGYKGSDRPTLAKVVLDEPLEIYRIEDADWAPCVLSS